MSDNIQSLYPTHPDEEIDWNPEMENFKVLLFFSISAA